jgi:hypothetical protein
LSLEHLVPQRLQFEGCGEVTAFGQNAERYSVARLTPASERAESRASRWSGAATTTTASPLIRESAKSELRPCASCWTPE